MAGMASSRLGQYDYSTERKAPWSSMTQFQTKDASTNGWDHRFGIWSDGDLQDLQQLQPAL